MVKTVEDNGVDEEKDVIDVTQCDINITQSRDETLKFKYSLASNHHTKT